MRLEPDSVDKPCVGWTVPSSVGTSLGPGVIRSPGAPDAPRVVPVPQIWEPLNARWEHPCTAARYFIRSICLERPAESAVPFSKSNHVFSGLLRTSSVNVFVD